MHNQFFSKIQGAVLAGLLACVAPLSANATVLSIVNNDIGNRSWQDIASTSYTWADTNGDSLVSVGEEVTFSVNMHKAYDGHHDFDALKFWFGDGASATAQWGEWTRVLPMWNSNDSYVNLNKTFEFKHTFLGAATYDIFASVTCEFDLSDLTGNANVVESSDWAAWSTSYHSGNRRQGETESYKFTVSAVPEPETYAMMLAGLGLMGTIARRRKSKAA